MREVSREEFQKRMTVMFNNEGISVDVDCATTNFDDMQKAGFVVFDRKELSLSASSKERSLRKLEQKARTIRKRLAQGCCENWNSMMPCGKECDEPLVTLEEAKQAFDEHFAEDKRFLGDLQKALEQKAKTTQYIVELYKAFKEEFRKGAMGHQDAYTNAIALRKDLEDTHWISTWDVWELFSGFEWRLKE